MKGFTLRKPLCLLFLFSVAACGPNGEMLPETLEETCAGQRCLETDINPPLNSEGIPDSELWSEFDNYDDLYMEDLEPYAIYSFPAYKSSWGLEREKFNAAENYYKNNQSRIKNRRYVTIIDFAKHSSNKRFYLFDLKTGQVEKYLTSHGKNSDPDNDGYATKFSNKPQSKMSSVGFYLTLSTYSGKYGYSMRLKGLSSTNSNAQARAIVMHPAPYVREAASYAGRSWGCPALDKGVSKKIIDRIRNGSLLYIDR